MLSDQTLPCRPARGATRCLIILAGLILVVGLARAAPPRVKRLVAIGDLHGDLEATKAALRLAGAIDQGERWIGGDLVVVQTGDLLDRGDDDVAMVFFLHEISTMAARAGGRLVMLNGNHELMNAAGDFRYVTVGGFTACRDLFAPANDRQALEDDEARAACFAPGRPLARILAQGQIVAVVGETVFAHGGVLPIYASYGIARLNRDVSAWLAGDDKAPAWLRLRDNPVWFRGFSMGEPDLATCQLLQTTLDLIGAKRMVVAHTVQRRINPGCDGRIWRIDVGMAAHYGGRVEVLEIEGETVRRLTAD